MVNYSSGKTSSTKPETASTVNISSTSRTLKQLADLSAKEANDKNTPHQTLSLVKNFHVRRGRKQTPPPPIHLLPSDFDHKILSPPKVDVWGGRVRNSDESQTLSREREGKLDIRKSWGFYINKGGVY